ncbi:pentapeptide repeat-containing protein [Micromonospora sp. WMMD754]|uniref:pentapeptide repeat-containing protein n=1 Tax=Micromonospora sp. WMMD754 TaxID=3404114 RepID=UPI003BF5C3B3
MSTPPGATRQSLVGRDLRHHTLDGHSFKLCDFRGADLRDTDLSYARFSYVMTHDPE